MKSKVDGCFFAVLVLAAALVMGSPNLMAVPLPDDGGRACSLASAAGDWSLTDNGSIVSPPLGSRVAVGRFTLTPDGNLVNGVATSSLNGTIASETFFGTYSVNPDCTGTIRVKIFSNNVELFEVTLSTAFDARMHELRGLFTSVVTPDGTSLSTVIGLNARRE